jgi:predicted adenylyl cyclase CyaB
LKNFEIKCRISNLSAIKEKLSSDRNYKYSVEKQRDIYYNVKSGRLKLRIINEKNSDLIYYNRKEKNSERVSNFVISSTLNFRELNFIMTEQFKVMVIVNKKREIFVKDNIRIHLDTVNKLGKFLEIEIMFKDLNKAKKLMEELKEMLNLNSKDFIKSSYSDLLINKN